MEEIENKKYVKMRNWMLDKLAEIYIFSIIIIFPLCVDSTGFFKILECKYRTFLFIGVTYIALNLIMIIYFYIFYKVKTFENIRLSKIQFAVLGFWGVNILATIFSPYNGKLTLDWQFNKDALCLLIIVGIFMLLAYILYKNEYAIEKKIIIKRMYIAMIIGILLMTLGLYFINFNSGTLYEVHELLHGNFDDQFGTYRIFLWKRAFKLLNKNWLIGSGPDTFAVRFMDQYTDDVKNIGELSINDTAGNVYITMLINIGVVGLLSYLIFMFIQLKEGIKRKNSCSIILLIAIVCFWIQDFFNLWVVIVTPIFWALMALHQLAISQESNNE